MKKTLELRLVEQQAILKTATEDAEQIRRPHCRDAWEVAEERERAVIIDKTLQQTQLTISKLVKAIEKVNSNDDSYGYCEQCGDEISQQRLGIFPEVEYCLSCQDKRTSS